MTVSDSSPVLPYLGKKVDLKSRRRHWRAIGISSAVTVTIFVSGCWVLIHHWIVPSWVPNAWYIALIASVIVWALIVLGDDV